MIEVRNIQVRCENNIGTESETVITHKISGVFYFQSSSDLFEFKKSLMAAFQVSYERVVFHSRTFLV